MKALDNAQFDDIKLLHRQVKSVLVDWAVAMLSQRIIKTNIGNSQCEAIAKQGTAQGGVLSALFWVLVVDELLHTLNQEHFQTIGYSDDLTIILQGADLVLLCDHMQLALQIVEQWCTQHVMKVNPNKTELIIFTHKRQTSGFKPLRLLATELVLTN